MTFFFAQIITHALHRKNLLSHTPALITLKTVYKMILVLLVGPQFEVVDENTKDALMELLKKDGQLD